jgi:hypothetical protein
MPLVHLIFFEDPRELTDEQVTEARLAGLLREDEPGGETPPDEPPADTPAAGPPPAAVTSPPVRPSTLPPAGGPAAPVPPIPGTTDRGTLTPP